MKPTSIPRASLSKPCLTRFSALLNSPLSPAESRKFLTLVKDSFRASLEASTPSEEPTDQHINRILSTVPFTIDQPTKESRLGMFLRDPLGIFDQQCLAGKADLDLAAICLNKYNNLRKMEDMNRAGAVPEELKWSAVYYVLEGLRKAGLGAPRDALTNPKLARAVAEGLVIEGKDDHIIMWSKTTKYETPLMSRQNLVYYGVQSVMMHHGWEKAAALFRDVIAGARPGVRFLKREYSFTGLMLCQAGMDQGFEKSITYEKLVYKSSVWGTHWQMQAWVCLNYSKRVNPGVQYFKSFIDKPDEDRIRLRRGFWFRHDSWFPFMLVQECLAQGMLEEAEMIKDIVERQFVGRVTQKSLNSMEMIIETAKAEVGISKKAKSGGDLQGALNALG